MDRTKLRKKLLAERSKWDAGFLQKLGDQIAGKVIASDWFKNSEVIHGFAGSAEKGEVMTLTLLQHIIHSGRTLVMPRVTDMPGVLSHHRVTDLAALVAGKWGILEPAGGKEISPEELDLILVPGIAADLQGNRIGYGLGYYDRFLSLSPARTMMLLPRHMVLESIPAQSHDIPVQALATEHGILVCRGNDQ